MAERYFQPPVAHRGLAPPTADVARAGVCQSDFDSTAPVEFAATMGAGGVELDGARQLARRSGRILRLGWAEFRLLELLMSYRGVVFYREQLVAIVWGTSAKIDLRTVDQKIARLRRALTLGSAPDPILSIRGKGYLFAEGADRDFARWQQLGPTKLRLHR